MIRGPYSPSSVAPRSRRSNCGDSTFSQKIGITIRTVVDNYYLYGGYGVTVNTEVCGAFDSGSIPDSRPKRE